jgi:hypothetical protein
MKKIALSGPLFSRRAVTIALGIAVGGAATLVLIQHRTHLLGLLPYALFLLCPWSWGWLKAGLRRCSFSGRTATWWFRLPPPSARRSGCMST